MFWNQYPYINLNDLNLDFLLKAIGEMQNEVENFVTLNAVKYADPIQWDITSQYEKNTIVIDPLTGTAYISVQPVPSGVALNRTEYWTPVFDLSLFITQGNANLTEHVEDSGVIYSTFALNRGNWVIWNGILYKALVNMPIGTAYSIDGNIERVTVEEYIHKIIDDLDTEIQARIDADNTINNTIGDLDDLNTSDKTSVVNAINEVNTSGGGAIAMIGDLNDLTTTDKTTVVNAINEVDSLAKSNKQRLDNNKVFNVLDYGAKGDGVTDDTNAIKTAIVDLEINGGVLYFPQGRYLISDTLNFLHVGICVRGDTQQGTYIVQTVNKTALHFGNGSTPTISYRVEHIGIVNTAATVTSVTYGIHYDYAVNSTIEDVVIGDFYVGLFLTHTGNSFIKDVGIVSSRANTIGINVGDQSVSSAFHNCYVGFNGAAVDSAIGFYCARGDIADISIDYMDIGNGAYGLFFNGSDSPNDYPPADIRLKNIVVDGSRIAAIHIQDINARGNVVIDGGWLNPHITATSHCIELSTVNNVMISNVIFQQLAELTAPTIIAISLYQTTNVNIEHCEFLNVAQAISGVTTDKTSFVNNHFKLYSGMTATTALYLSGAYANIITSNNFYGNITNGVVFDAAGDYTIITNNIFTGVTTSVTDPHTNTINTNNLG